ncbi:MAG: hypothetical protein KJO41_05660 [Bacteroidia bacterium]|nr:hypothetical protein [Bacteroidia bacterium]MBT8278469.1 hypothetical protein [Bacteroidia bacterium]NND24612.1 hypothetical protein [Flavobacteriaceae bacterium]NNK61288.1 hypothetical protein [Flavobacteriaceae bacterium]NNL31846.1 hypothetical protein [Flavobacteriaceae bacterium]
MSEINVFNRRVFIKDLVIISIIVALPFLFYLYLLVPEVKIWKTSFFTFDSRYYQDVSVFAWAAFTKILTLFFLSLWFVTCKHWWRMAIVIPIIIETYKLMVIINDETYYVDKYEVIWAIPLVIPIIIFLIYMSKKLNYYNLSKSLDHNLDLEIEHLINELRSNVYLDYKEKLDQFEKLKAQKDTLKKKAYLEKLIALKNGIQLD